MKLSVGMMDLITLTIQMTPSALQTLMTSSSYLVKVVTNTTFASTVNLKCYFAAMANIGMRKWNIAMIHIKRDVT